MVYCGGLIRSLDGYSWRDATRLEVCKNYFVTHQLASYTSQCCWLDSRTVRFLWSEYFGPGWADV